MSDSKLGTFSPNTPTRSNDSDETKATRRGRPVGDREAKRAELLASAISVIAKQGYAGASMRKVAKEAGCTTGAVTYYFANKEEMVSAVAQSLFDQFDTMLDPGDRAVDVRVVIQQWLDWTNLNETDTWLAVFQLLAHARHEPAFARVIQQRYARFRHALAALLSRGQEQGAIRSDIPAELLADQLSAMSDGWMMMHPIERDRFESNRARSLLDALITLISPTPQARR